MTQAMQRHDGTPRRLKASYASVIIDYGHYYRDLHASITKAKKSIFLVGWDIDSRINLLRGQDKAKADSPSVLFDLIIWKAKNNPDLQIYLNCWDYSVFLMGKREIFWKQKWRAYDLSNIHVCMDNKLPLMACHHQKIAVIDDEVAFCGGMDISIGRWDFRQHHVRNKYRETFLDESGEPLLSPYHDIQIAFAGEAVKTIANWARTRWNLATPKQLAIPYDGTTTQGLPHTWPSTNEPDFKNVEMSLMRTIPAMKGQEQVEEIHRSYLSEIKKAENFIYIENQYLVLKDIARALNAQLHAKPNLRIMVVSSRDPNGYIEKLSMWGGRFLFRKILESGGVGNRIIFAHPMSMEHGVSTTIRIHSKLMVIDDKILHVGSANLNNRSMGLDTECDATFYGDDDAATKNKIAFIRNDLIREHTGYDINTIQKIVNGEADFSMLLEDRKDSRQHLYNIQDKQYRNSPFYTLACKLSDLRHPPFYQFKFADIGKFILSHSTLFLLLMVTVLLSLAWYYTPLAEYSNHEELSRMLFTIRDEPLALLWVVLVYVGAALLFFPVTVLSTAVVLIFGGVKGFVYSIIGAMIGATIGYYCGKFIGIKTLKATFGARANETIKSVQASGVIGMTMIRMVPIAPFSLINLILGAIGISYLPYIIGTVLGMAPGKIVLAIFGDTILSLFNDPSAEKIAYASLGVILWASVIWASNKLANKWQHRGDRKTASSVTQG